MSGIPTVYHKTSPTTTVSTPLFPLAEFPQSTSSGEPSSVSPQPEDYSTDTSSTSETISSEVVSCQLPCPSAETSLGAPGQAQLSRVSQKKKRMNERTRWTGSLLAHCSAGAKQDIPQPFFFTCRFPLKGQVNIPLQAGSVCVRACAFIRHQPRRAPKTSPQHSDKRSSN